MSIQCSCQVLAFARQFNELAEKFSALPVHSNYSGKATPPIDYKAIVKMVEKGAGDEDNQISKDVAFGAKPLNKAGYMPIGTKGKSMQVYAKCEGGNTKPKDKTIGQLRSGRPGRRRLDDSVLHDLPRSLTAACPSPGTRTCSARSQPEVTCLLEKQASKGVAAGRMSRSPERGRVDQANGRQASARIPEIAICTIQVNTNKLKLPRAAQFFASFLVVAGTGVSTVASAQDKPDLTSLAGFVIGKTCFAPVGRQWIEEQAKRRLEARTVDEGGGFYRADYYADDGNRRLTVNVSCAPGDVAWKISLYTLFHGSGERREPALERAYARFGKPVLYTDMWADKTFRQAGVKEGKFGSGLSAFWATEPAPWKGSINTSRPREQCAGKPDSLRSICLVSESMKEETSRVIQLRGIVTAAQFVFDGVEGNEVLKNQSIEMTDIAMRARYERASADHSRAQHRAAQAENDRRAAQSAPKY